MNDPDDINDYQRGFNAGCLVGIVLSAATALVFLWFRWAVP